MTKRSAAPAAVFTCLPLGWISAEEAAEGSWGNPFTPPELGAPEGKQEALLAVIMQVHPGCTVEFARLHVRYLRDHGRVIPNYIVQPKNHLTPEQRDTIMAAYTLLFK